MHRSGNKYSRIFSIETVLLALICLVGALVIAGWHLQVRALVQVLPGMIAMQYNTALCFVLLTVGSIAALHRWGTRGLPLICFSIVGLMGWAVVYQYAFSSNLGIDTLFFVPWENTLSAYPGRMALTTAICFGIVGWSAVLYLFKRKGLFAFALGLTFPLSLGLTSLFGYLFGVTYVLPFRLGSQMALHTAASFTLFSVAMLIAIWRRLPESAEGLPKWSPGIAIVAAPALFIGLSSFLQSDSLVSNLGRVLLAVAGTALLAYAIHQLRNVRVAYKGAILIGVPLLFVLAFVLLVNQQKESTTQAQKWESHSGEVIGLGRSVLERIVTAESNLRAYVITGKVEYVRPYKAAAADALLNLATLKQLVIDNPAQSAAVDRLMSLAEERLSSLRELEDLMAIGSNAAAIAHLKEGSGTEAMEAFRAEMGRFLSEEGRLSAARNSELQDSWQRFDWLLVTGAAVDLILALTLAFLFTRVIGRRLAIMSENAKALTEGKKLAEPLTGTDEIARLDQTFHTMAAALTDAHENLEAKVVERTRELAEVSAEIRELNESLERRIQERTSQLEAANKELEAFTYSVSHDLRAPLRAIDGFARIFEEDYMTTLDAEAVRLLGVIRGNAQNMGNLIDDLLAFSRLGRKQIEPTEIDMTELARSVAEDLKVASAAPEESLSIDALPPVKGDKALIRQVFVNLISNAVKYSKQTEDCRIQVGARAENGEAIYYVRDNGVGFDMNYADKLFGVFQRLHSAEEFEGTGVGLAIVQRIVHRHGGRVWAEGSVNAGATFYFSLPVNGAHASNGAKGRTDHE